MSVLKTEVLVAFVTAHCHQFTIGTFGNRTGKLEVIVIRALLI